MNQLIIDFTALSDWEQVKVFFIITAFIVIIRYLFCWFIGTSEIADKLDKIAKELSKINK